MSLLNEALRKKSREKGRAGNETRAFSAGRPSPPAAGKSLRVSAALLAAAGIAGSVWLWYAPEPPAGPSRVAQQQPAPPEEVVANAGLAPPDLAPAPATTAPGEAAGTAGNGRPGTASPKKRAKPPQVRLAAAVSPHKTDLLPPASADAAASPKPAGQLTEAVKPYWEKALSYHREKQFAQAVAMYSEVLKRAPEHAEALLNLSAVHIEMQSFSQAYPLLKDLEARFPENPAVWLNLAMAEIGLGRPERALADLRRAEQAGGESFDIHLHRGAALSRLGRAGEALASYQQAERLRPDEPSLIFNLAVAYDRQEQFGEALSYYQSFIALGSVASATQKKLVEERVAVLRAYLATRNRTNQSS